MKEYISKINCDADSISGQMFKLEMSEVWAPAEEDESFLGLLAKPPGMEPEGLV